MIQLLNNKRTPEQIIFITEKSQLPAPVAGVITLPANGWLYYFLDIVDLGGDTLKPTNNVLQGSSQETAGLANGSVIFENDCPVFKFRFNNCPVVFNGVGTAYDWAYINFYNTPNCVTVNNAANIVWNVVGFINSYGVTIAGAIDSFVLTNSIFRSVSEPSCEFITIAATAVINRRIRIEDSVFATSNVAQTAFFFFVGATIGDESLLFEDLRFTGVGLTVVGINGNDDRAMFKGCIGTGIINTAVKGFVYMKNNATATTVLVIGDRYEVAGTKLLDTTYAQRFNLVSNRLQYTSDIPKQVSIQLSGTATSAANNVVGTYIGICRNGNTIDPTADRISESEMYTTMTGTRPEGVFCQCITTLGSGDRIYAITQNTTAINDVTYSFMNFIVREA